MIYKKGKAHRVLVCPIHGVLATNPFSASGALQGGAAGAALGSVVPGVGTAIGAGIGSAIGGFSLGDSTDKKTSPQSHPTVLKEGRRSFSTEERVRLALASGKVHYG